MLSSLLFSFTNVKPKKDQKETERWQEGFIKIHHFQ